MPQYAMAQSGSAAAALSKQLTASSWLNAYVHASPRSNQRCASGERVDTGRVRVPRSKYSMNVSFEGW